MLGPDDMNKWGYCKDEVCHERNQQTPLEQAAENLKSLGPPELPIHLDAVYKRMAEAEAMPGDAAKIQATFDMMLEKVRQL